MKRMLWVGLLVLACTPVGVAQVPMSDANRARLDALLREADGAGMLAWRREGGAPDAVHMVLSRIGARRALGAAEVKVYVLQQTSLGASFTDVLAGPDAARLFQRFLELTEREDYASALVHIESARYLYAQRTREVTDELKYAQRRVFGLIQRGHFVSARSALNGVQPYLGSQHPHHVPLIDKLETQRVQIDAGLAREERRALAYEREGTALFRGGLSLRVGASSRASPSAADLPLVNVGEVGFSGFEGGAEFVVSGEAHLYATRRFAFGAGGTWSQTTFRNSGSTDLVQADVPVWALGGYGFGRLLLRDNLGVRPYVALGAGVLRLVREEAQGAGVLPGERQIRQFVIQGDPSVGLQGRAGVGVEYVSCSTCAFSAGGEITVLAHTIDAPLAPGLQVAFGIHAAYNF